MNAEEVIVRQILEALGAVNAILREHASAITARNGVRSAVTRFEVADYKSNTVLEGFVDAEMEDGTGLCWALDVTWTKSSFQIEGSLDRYSSLGSDTLKKVQTQVVNEANLLPLALTEATQALLALRPD